MSFGLLVVIFFFKLVYDDVLLSRYLHLPNGMVVGFMLNVFFNCCSVLVE